MTTTATSTASAFRAGRAGVTEQAADTAVDQPCRMLRLPTMRARFAEVADSAQREQLTFRGFLAELLMAECDDRDRRRPARQITAAGFRGRSGCRTSATTPTLTSSRPSSPSSPRALG